MIYLYPEIILNSHSFQTVPTHGWGLSATHNKNLVDVMKKQTDLLNPFKNERVLSLLLENVAEWRGDVNMFMNNIPMSFENPNEKGEPCLFSQNTLQLLVVHIWYSVLFQFIQSADNDELVKIDVQEGKKERRKHTEDNNDELLYAVPRREEINNAGNVLPTDLDELENVEIVAGNRTELKEKVSSLLEAFLKIFIENKRTVDKIYEDIKKNVNLSKQDEKNKITDYLAKMKQEDREVEDLFKQYKMGRWNKGTQKGVYQYDKDIYDAEQTADVVERMFNENGGGGISLDATEYDAEQQRIMNGENPDEEDGYAVEYGDGEGDGYGEENDGGDGEYDE